jgi:hypothetical protein
MVVNVNQDGICPNKLRPVIAHFTGSVVGRGATERFGAGLKKLTYFVGFSVPEEDSIP